MTTLNMFNDPFFIGFDSLINRLNKIDKSSVTNYPPYNIIKTGDDSYLLELAVAGFMEDDINIQLHDGVLTVSANVGDVEDTTEYLHKGIAARSFVRKFTLADTIEVDGANMEHGMLRVNLKNIVPEEKKPRKIPISKSEKVLLTE